MTFAQDGIKVAVDEQMLISYASISRGPNYEICPVWYNTISKNDANSNGIKNTDCCLKFVQGNSITIICVDEEQ